jgi:hypothetical protein
MEAPARGHFAVATSFWKALPVSACGVESRIGASNGVRPQEFQKLPGSATEQFQGRSMTKDHFLAEVRQKQSRSSSRPRADAAPAKQFEQKERARIAAKNSSLRALEWKGTPYK